MIKYLEGKGSLMAFSLHNTGQAITIPTVNTCNTPYYNTVGYNAAVSYRPYMYVD